MDQAPCYNALSAQPGDRIFFKNNNGDEVHETVKNALWTEAPKGGKIWTYETTDGYLVANHRVTKVLPPVSFTDDTLSLEEKAVTKQLIESEEFGNLIAKQKLRQLILRTGISPSLQTVIGCVMDGDAANLEVAAFLISKRIKELQELAAASKSFDSELSR